MREPNYVWRDPSGSVTISISLRLLSRLVSAGQNAAATGWLLGQSGLHDGVHIVSIEKSAPGSASPVPGAVGMYCLLRTSEALSIQPDDEDLFRQRFIGEDSVFLLVQPSFGRAAFFTAAENEFLLRHEFTFRAPEPRRSWLPPVARSRHWIFEVVALVLGLVAGIVLIQRFQPPPSVAQVALKAPPPLTPSTGDASRTADASGEPVTAEVPPELASKPSPWEPATGARLQPHETDTHPPPTTEAAKPSYAPASKTPVPAVTSAPPPSATKTAVPEPAPATPVAPTPAPVEHAAAAPPPRNIPPVTRNIPREPEPQITVQAEPVASSRLSKAIGHVPLLRRLGHKGPAVVPPSPVKQVSPRLSARDRAELTDPVLINVRVYVDESGKVEFAELMTDARRHPNLSSAAVYASRRWDFTPAAQGGQPVPGEVILHYRFAPPAPPSSASAQN